MNIIKMNNKGFTLLEMTVCFLLLGILLVAAAQVITSSTEAYYLSKGTSYGMQVSQVIATEIRGDIEDAVMMKLVKPNNTETLQYKKLIEYPNNIDNAISKSVYIGTDNHSIFFINGSGEQIGYFFDKTSENGILNRSSIGVYDEYFDLKVDQGAEVLKSYTSKYVGMNYSVKDISFKLFDKELNKPSADIIKDTLPVGDFPVLEVEIIVNSPQYGDYTCNEYIALYSFYGLTKEQIEALIMQN